MYIDVVLLNSLLYSLNYCNNEYRVNTDRISSIQNIDICFFMYAVVRSMSQNG